MVAGAVGDGPPWNRVDLVAQIDVFDPAVSDQHPIGTWTSPGLDIYLDEWQTAMKAAPPPVPEQQDDEP